MPAAAVSAARAPVLTLSLPPKATPWRRSSFKGVFDSGPGAAVPPVIGEQAWTGGRAGLRREPRIPRHADRRPGLDAPQKTNEAASCQNPGARARSRCWHLRHRVVAPRGPAALVCAWVRGWDGHGDGDGMGHGDRDAGTNEGPPAAPPRGSIRPGPPNRLRTRAIAAFSHSFSIPTPGFQQSPLVPPFPCLPFPPPPTHFVRSHKTTKTTDAPGWMDRRRAVGLSAVRTQPIHPIPFPCPPPALSANLVRCRPPRDPFDTSPKGNPEEGLRPTAASDEGTKGPPHVSQDTRATKEETGGSPAMPPKAP
ncbi:hypothetical protein Purlil1_4872 [Purpureocillium lilacinum]|uniref:Uncharacterized protein n=1 Tax=Purpureocillium lilacinum TaxID=33203 RepID=A0ABR0C413_PURLI|nr:hypothetical protein Purlil1_4872 [Purpureocillium lilacinum]